MVVSSCSSSVGSRYCTLDIPILDGNGVAGLAAEGRFYLMAFAHSLNTRESNARFLIQTTFGPTTESLDSFTGSYADWVRIQMDMSPTLHREYFRKRGVDGNALDGDSDGSVTSSVLGIRGPYEK